MCARGFPYAVSEYYIFLLSVVQLNVQVKTWTCMNSKVLDRKQVCFFFKYVKVRGLVFSIITSYSKVWRNAWFEHLGKNTSVLAEVWLWKSKTEAVGVSENHKSFI